jgi:signal transduction histidine kinase
MVLRVSDNGRGFDVGCASAGHGLRSMRERTMAIGGSFDAQSRPGGGATLTFTIPLTDHAQVDAAVEHALPA